MDAVQFEYGLNLAYRIGSLDLLGEYSRSSFHPFRDDADENYRVNTTDYVRIGVMPPPFRLGPDGGRVRFFAHIEPELLLLRGGGVDVDLYTAAGLRLPGDFGNLDLFLHYTRIGDVKELHDGAGNQRPFGVNLIGLGFRFSAQP